MMNKSLYNGMQPITMVYLQTQSELDELCRVRPSQTLHRLHHRADVRGRCTSRPWQSATAQAPPVGECGQEMKSEALAVRVSEVLSTAYAAHQHQGRKPVRSNTARTDLDEFIPFARSV